MSKVADLVYLRFASTCYTTVTSKKPDDVELNAKDNTWTYIWQDLGYQRERTFRIGQGRSYFESGTTMGWKHGTIGVYDRTDVKQLDAMVHCAREATRDRSWHDD